MKLHVIACLATLTALNIGCSAAGGGKGENNGSGATANGNGGTSSLGAQPSLGGSIALGGGVGTDPVDDGSGNPENCADAAMGHTYVGCDFWPTIVANPVWQEFQPAVVIANGTAMDASVTIDGPAGFHQVVTV